MLQSHIALVISLFTSRRNRFTKLIKPQVNTTRTNSGTETFQKGKNKR